MSDEHDWRARAEKAEAELARVRAIADQGLRVIIAAWDGDDDSMSADPSVIAQHTLAQISVTQEAGNDER